VILTQILDGKQFRQERLKITRNSDFVKGKRKSGETLWMFRRQQTLVVAPIQ
jgi:hypothetical protein